MRLCECVTFSQNSCVCVCVTGTVCADFRLKAAAVDWRAACWGRRGEIQQICTASVRCISDAVNGFLHPRLPFTDGQVAVVLVVQMRRENRVHQKCFLLIRPLIQIPHKLEFCSTLCGLGPGFNPFYIPGLLWWAALLCSKLKKMIKVQCWMSSSQHPWPFGSVWCSAKHECGKNAGFQGLLWQEVYTNIEYLGKGGDLGK